MYKTSYSGATYNQEKNWKLVDVQHEENVSHLCCGILGSHENECSQNKDCKAVGKCGDIMLCRKGKIHANPLT